MQDPAFLFYYQDFLVGSMFMSNEETGAYIRILCHLADKGKLTIEQIYEICENNDNIEKKVLTKLTKDKNGFYYNKRLRAEIRKRRIYSESRRKNRIGNKNNNMVNNYDNHMSDICKSYDKHMEDENENVIENNIKNKRKENIKRKEKAVNLKEHPFITEFEELWKLYPRKDGRKQAIRHMAQSISTTDELNLCRQAVNNYSSYLRENDITMHYTKNGNTFFNNWHDWVEKIISHDDDRIPIRSEGIAPGEL